MADKKTRINLKLLEFGWGNNDFGESLVKIRFVDNEDAVYLYEGKSKGMIDIIGEEYESFVTVSANLEQISDNLYKIKNPTKVVSNRVKSDISLTNSNLEGCWKLMYENYNQFDDKVFWIFGGDCLTRLILAIKFKPVKFKIIEQSIEFEKDSYRIDLLSKEKLIVTRYTKRWEFERHLGEVDTNKYFEA